MERKPTLVPACFFYDFDFCHNFLFCHKENIGIDEEDGIGGEDDIDGIDDLVVIWTCYSKVFVNIWIDLVVKTSSSILAFVVSSCPARTRIKPDF